MWETIVVSVVVAVAIFLIIKKTFFTKKNNGSCKCSCEPTCKVCTPSLEAPPEPIELSQPKAEYVTTQVGSTEMRGETTTWGETGTGEESDVKPVEVPPLPKKKKAGKKKRKVVENA